MRAHGEGGGKEERENAKTPADMLKGKAGQWAALSLAADANLSVLASCGAMESERRPQLTGL